MKVVVFTPTFNEKDNIIRLLEKILQQARKVKGVELRVLVVDDNSPDGTAKLVRPFAKKHKNVYLLSRERKEGLGAAYLAGMEYSFGRLKADVAIVLDADLSHDPRYIPQFLHGLNGSDMVIGSRYVKGGSIPKNWAPHRKFYSFVGNKVACLMLNRPEISDWTSGYRAIKKQVYCHVSPLMKKKELRGYTFNISFAYYAAQLGFKVDHIPLNFIDRTSGKSKLGLEYLFYTPIFLFKTRLKGILHIN